MQNPDNIYLNPSSEYKVNEETRFAPIIACIRYICNRVLKKASVWITLAIFDITYVLSLLIPMFFSYQSRLYMISSLNLYAAIFLCFGAGSQGIMQAINTFIDPQKDGTEILLVSKPITRGQIVSARFIFLIGFGLFQALVTAILSCIPIFIIGTKSYSMVGIPATTIIFGGFGASFLSFMIMGSVAILVGLFSDGKIARTLPIVVLSLSGTIAVVNAQIAPIISGDPLYSVSQDIIKEINQDLEKHNYDNIPATLPGGTETNKIKSLTLENSLFRLYYVSETEQFIYVDAFVTAKRGILNYESINFKSTVTNENNKELPQLDPIQKEWITYFNKKLIETKQFNAKWTTAISFINPQSAFLTMTGVGKSSQSGLLINMLSPNYTYNSFREEGKDKPFEIKDSYNFSENNQYAYNVIKFKSQQIDTPWAVAIMWGGLFLISSGILILAYYRKDFK